MSKTLFIILPLLLIACQPAWYWHHPTATFAETEQIKKECQFEAEKSADWSNSGAEIGWQMGRVKDACMQAKGFERKPIERK